MPRQKYPILPGLRSCLSVVYMNNAVLILRDMMLRYPIKCKGLKLSLQIEVCSISSSQDNLIHWPCDTKDQQLAVLKDRAQLSLACYTQCIALCYALSRSLPYTISVGIPLDSSYTSQQVPLEWNRALLRGSKRESDGLSWFKTIYTSRYQAQSTLALQCKMSPGHRIELGRTSQKLSTESKPSGFSPRLQPGAQRTLSL